MEKETDSTNAGEDMPKNNDLTIKRVNVDFPGWMVEELDKESKRLGISRQALVKVWIAEKIKELEA